jgi:hypothetical protein
MTAGICDEKVVTSFAATAATMLTAQATPPPSSK